MKRTVMILFGIISISLLCIFVFCVIFWNVNRIKGMISVTVNGENYLLESLECKYGEDVEKISYERKPFGIAFKNRGSRYGMYEYSFFVRKEEFDKEFKIRVFKTNWWEIYNINMDLNIYEDDGIWKADIFIDCDDRIYQETFDRIENDVIEFRVE